MASMKPIFSNALFHSRMPSRTYWRYSRGTVRSIQKMIGCLGGDFSAVGLLFFQVPAGDVVDVGRLVDVFG